MRILGTATKGLFVLSLPILLLSASIAWEANSLWLYNYGFEKYTVSQATSLAKPELEKVAAGLISYFNSAKEYISLTVLKNGEPFELFNEKEIIHLKDVKELIRLDYRFLLGALIYFLSYAGISLFWCRGKYQQQLAWGVVWGSSTTLALMLALGLGTILNFDQLFLQFHLIGFSNELWQLDPTKDYLIMLFPQGFFYDIALFCVLTTAGVAIILGGVAGAYLVVKRRVTHFKTEQML